MSDETDTSKRERIALVLGGGAPTLTLQAGALLALDEKGVEFDVISTSGAGMLVGLLYAAPKGRTRREALRSTVDLGVHDAIYNLFPINYKVFCKPGPLASIYYRWTMPLIHALPQGSDLERLWKDWVHFWAAAWSPSSMSHNSLGMCEAAPWLEDVIDFDALRTFAPAFYINAWSIGEKKMKVFSKHELTAAHFRAALAFPLIYPPYKLDNDYYIEGSAMDTLNLGGLLRYDMAYDAVYPALLEEELMKEWPKIGPAFARGDRIAAEHCIKRAKRRADRRALAAMRDRRDSSIGGRGASPGAAPPSDSAARAAMRANPLCAAAFAEREREAGRLDAVDRIVVFDVLGTDALIRQPRNLYDAWVLQMIVPLVSLANQEINEFHEDFDYPYDDERRILHEIRFDRYIEPAHLVSALDWSYSNLKRLFEIGYKAGQDFHAKKKWLQARVGPAGRAAA
jgi:predicted acylesterase/phospholipase RssA